MKGWVAEYARLRGLVAFDAEGWPCDGDGTRLLEVQVAALPPLLQLECRARWALGDVPIYDEGEGNKRTETHVNLQLQRRNHEWFCEWQARLGITVAYFLDATHTVARDKDGIPLRDRDGEVVGIDARAAV